MTDDMCGLKGRTIADMGIKKMMMHGNEEGEAEITRVERCGENEDSAAP